MAEPQTTDLRFPVAGVDRSRAFSDQRPREVAEGVYGRTTPVGVNVRGFEATADRRRGGTRPGLRRYVDDQAVGEDWIIQQLDVVVYASADAASQAGRF